MGDNVSRTAGGRANETGSVYRAGVAAYLAAYGLAETRLLFGDDVEPMLVSDIWLETSAEVDDLRCEFRHGQRWDIQAKSSITWGPKFAQVVEQWVAAARSGSLRPSDRTVLISGFVSGPLRTLADALSRCRTDGEEFLLPAERHALEKLRGQALAAGWDPVFDSVAAHAAIFELSSADRSSAGFREAGALLEGTVVAGGSGATAMDALARFFHVDSRRAGRSGGERWLRTIDLADIPRAASSQPQQDRAARRLLDYRDRVAGSKDLLDVDVLGNGLPHLHVPDLLGTYRVVIDHPGRSRGNEVALKHLGRRWSRFTIVGLPGGGKSSSARQLAAWMAEDLEAPLPIVVRLGDLTQRLRREEWIGVTELCSAAYASTEHVAPLLEQHLMDGTAVLILDGLDECRDQQGRAALLVRRLSNAIHVESGLVLTARETSEHLVRTLNLPLVRLGEPSEMRKRVDELLEHALAARTGDTAAESRDRLAWIEQSRSSNNDIWSVPLFAVLLAVHAAQAPLGALPPTRADSLVAAIRDSVARWEREKADPAAAWSPDLRPEMLIDGFAAVGHCVVAGGASSADCAHAVAEVLERKWSNGHAEASAAASDVMSWWVERVGAFMDLPDGQMTARVSMLAEIGDALWVGDQSHEVQRAWAQSSIGGASGSPEPLLLAAVLDSKVAQIVVELAADEPAAALAAARSTTRGARLSSHSLETLVGRLVDWAGAPDVRIVDDDHSDFWGTRQDEEVRCAAPGLPNWSFVLALAALPLPEELREQRDDFIGSIDEPERSVVAGALSAATDVAYDGAPPSAAQVAALESVLALPVPDKESEPVRESRRHVVFRSGEPILSGRGDAAKQAVRLLTLDERLAENAALLSRRLPAFEGAELADMVRAAGHGEAVRRHMTFPLLNETLLTDINELPVDLQYLCEAAIQHAHAIHPDAVTETPWRLRSIGSIMGDLSLAKMPVYAARLAVQQHPDLVDLLVRLSCDNISSGAAQVAADAEIALELLNEEPLDAAMLLFAASDPSATAPSISRRAIGGPEDLHGLQRCLTSANDMLFWGAAKWLFARPEDSERLATAWGALPGCGPRHRESLAFWLFDSLDEAELLARLDDPDPIIRLAAARKATQTLDPSTVTTSLASSEDLSVRVAAIKGAAARDAPDLVDELADVARASEPVIWTCTTCGSIERMETRDCSSCTRGARSDLGHEIDQVMRTRPA